MSQCASCGKGGDGLKICNGCKQVKYCNTTCQISHRPKHKQKCKKRAAEIFDQALFKEPPPREDCPICFLRLPCSSLCNYQTCCGKEICNGCVHSFIDLGAETLDSSKTDCPFCREPCHDTDEEAIERIKKRLDVNPNNGEALHFLAFNYLNGTMSLPQDTNKSFELWVRAAELGSVDACNSVANSYHHGRGVGKDKKKENHYRQLAANGGHPIARYNLGWVEEDAGNMNRAVKHYMLAAGGGFDQAMAKIKEAFLKGFITKDELRKTLQAYKDYQNDVKSDARDKAAAAIASGGWEMM